MRKRILNLWQRIPSKARAQGARFGRLFAVALVAQGAALQGQHPTRTVILSALVGAAEVTWRQFVKPPETKPSA